ncbi:MAG: alanine--tRNA ligase, partial [Gemmatimonadetes bacterium]|nr:alanine--tRNA ligase [Gemmatimonadota bacterium]
MRTIVSIPTSKVTAGSPGPCGPCSELLYDRGPEFGDEYLGGVLDEERYLEVWNLVFMQYNQDETGRRTPLPRPGVDTGMRLERLLSVMQGELVNYNTDLFAPAMDRVQTLLADGERERREHEIAYRVIADHGRAATFLIADGVLPG